MPTALHVTAEARPRFIRPLRELVADVARDHGLSERRVYDVKLCVSEAMTNALRHAYRGRPGPVEMTVRDLGEELEVVVADRGRGLASPARDGSQGFGLSVISHLTRRCTVRAVDGRGMEVEMLFPLPRTPRDRRDPHLARLAGPTSI